VAEHVGPRELVAQFPAVDSVDDAKTTVVSDGELREGKQRRGVSAKEYIQFITLCWSLFLAGKSSEDLSFIYGGQAIYNSKATTMARPDHCFHASRKFTTWDHFFPFPYSLGQHLLV
jgi:hypothetical protein